ncbi:flavin reductase [Pseudolabrys taiwanensis]|uniref:Flavin reductase n=1 Tax=Pseudolabrys taiwanensis TaxID=331696 RepID=A0A345ZTX3_9HYPH|nr:flavin reductase family protein [Pseudolabrys taiwanensis]AXK80370.1 flavin reductase [Pseudolabrys taiwanensis]
MNVQGETAFDSKLFRRVMGRFASGVTVITTEVEGAVRGMTANAFMSGSLTPPLCIISVAKKARMHDALQNSGHFGVSILAQGQESVSQHFAGQGAADPDLLFEHMHGIPVLAHVSAAIASKVAAVHDCGDHTIFIGHIVGLRDDERTPLLYYAGKYAVVHPKKELPADPSIDFWELPPE